MKAYTRRRLLAAAKMGAAAVPFVVAIRAASGAFLPGSIILGFGLGFTVGVSELFLLRNWLRDLPFLLHILAKSVALLGIMAAAFAVLNLLDVIIDGITWEQYARRVVNRDTLVGLIQLLAVIAFLLFFVQLDRLLGPGVLIGFVTGRFHKPRREQRIFMFLDLQGSTTLGDTLTSEQYFSFLHEYFSEMSEPILETDAEIYQYVGDEVVLSWHMRSGLEEANCVRVFFLITDQLKLQHDRFVRHFGQAPAFKAGLHAGEVITAQIGELKKDIVYNGDVLNTTSRIQSKCNELDERLLVSRSLIDRLQLDASYRVRELGPIDLRGKAEPIHLCAVTRLQASH